MELRGQVPWRRPAKVRAPAVAAAKETLAVQLQNRRSLTTDQRDRLAGSLEQAVDPDILIVGPASARASARQPPVGVGVVELTQAENQR